MSQKINKTHKKLMKLKAMAEMCNKQEKTKAMQKSDGDYDYRAYRIIDVEYVGKDDIDMMPNISIYLTEVNSKGYHRQYSSWTDIPHDVVFDAWTCIKEMGNDYHKEFSSITELVRKVSRVGFDGMKFGRYTRTFKSINYLDFSDVNN